MAENSGDLSLGYMMGQDSGGGGFGNFGEGLWAVIILAILFGRGGFGGFGGFGGDGGCATQADVRAAVDQQTLISKLDQQTYGLADSTYALNNTIVNGFHGVDRGLCDIGHQISDCCCTTQRSIDSVKYDMAKGFCDLGNVINMQTRDIIDNQNAGTREILNFLTQDKISTLQAENQALKFAASQASQNAFITANQEAQTAELIRRLGRDCPVPAYVVPNPNCCYGNPLGVGYNGAGGCGCGC